MSSASQPFSVEILDSASGARILQLSGALTLQTLFDFQTVSRQEITKPVILDVSGVPYMDSAGLGCIVSVFTSCQRSKRGFGITGMTDRIQTLFKVTHIDGLLPCYGSIAEAEAAVQESKDAPKAP
jgi:anti-sigma B factor antagonist